MRDNKAMKKEAPETQETKIARRQFLRTTALAAAATAAAAGGITHVARQGSLPKDPTGDATIRKIPELTTVSHDDKADPLIRMREELRRAMANAVEQRCWMMVINTKKCVGCHACTVACIAENKLPPGVVSFALGWGHWATGAEDILVDGEVIKGDKRRSTGVHANAAMWIDRSMGNNALSTPWAGA